MKNMTISLNNLWVKDNWMKDKKYLTYDEMVYAYRREKIATAILAGTSPHECTDITGRVKFVIEIADELIKQLDGEN